MSWSTKPGEGLVELLRTTVSLLEQTHDAMHKQITAQAETLAKTAQRHADLRAPHKKVRNDGDQPHR